MPRALDIKQLTPDYDPTRSGTEFHFGNLIKDMAEIWPYVLEQLAGNLLGPLLDAFSELTGIDFSGIKSLLEDLDFSSPEAFLQSLFSLIMALPGMILQLAGSLISGGGLLGGNSPLDGFNLFNTQGLFDNIPYAHIGDGQPNLLQHPGFDTAASVAASGAWLWDSLVGRAAAGSLKIVADGTDHALAFNTIEVSAGQQMSLTIYSMWSGLMYGGGGGGGGGTAAGMPSTLPISFSGAGVLPGTPAGLPLALPFALSGGSGSGGAAFGLPLTLPFVLGAPGTGVPLKVQVLRMLDGLVVGTDDLQVPTSLAADQAWMQLGGAYTVPAGTDAVRLQLAVTADATAGTLWFDDGNVKKTGLMQMPWIDGLPGSLGELGDGIQGIIDTIFQAITGFGEVDNLLEDIFLALQQIPFLNILGIGGPSNIGGSMQGTWDQLISGLVGQQGTGAGLADLFNVSRDVSSWASLGRLGWDILGIRNNQSLFTGFSQTSVSNMNMQSLAFNKNTSGAATAPTVPVTQSTALTGWHRVAESTDIAHVGATGYFTGSLTALYINISAMDSDGNVSNIHHSTNQVGLLGLTMQDISYSFSPPISLGASDLIGIEFHPVGSGTLNLVGDVTWRNFNHTSVVPRRWSAKRDGGTSSATPATVAAASVDYNTTNVPFTEYGVSAGSVLLPHSPEPRQFNTPGSTTVVIPSWSQYIDVITLGGGGGGQGCGLVWGEGGDGGTWDSEALERGVDIPDSTAILNVTVGAGGNGVAGFGAAGDPGQASTVSGVGWAGLSAAGGAGGSAGNADTDGKSPGNYTHNGIVYAGGSVQGSMGGDGAPPGGGGGGSTFTFVAAGNGAPGAVFIVFRQS